MSITAEQIEQLGKYERLQLAEDLWDRFAAESGRKWIRPCSMSLSIERIGATSILAKAGVCFDRTRAWRAPVTWQVLFEPPAEAEIVAAFEWYEQHSYGLGGDFYAPLLRLLNTSRGHPIAFPLVGSAFDGFCFVVSLCFAF